MKKIAILACLNANDVCAGASCLFALDGRKALFECYTGDEVKLCAFMRCSRCGIDKPIQIDPTQKLFYAAPSTVVS